MKQAVSVVDDASGNHMSHATAGLASVVGSAAEAVNDSIAAAGDVVSSVSAAALPTAMNHLRNTFLLPLIRAVHTYVWCWLVAAAVHPVIAITWTALGLVVCQCNLACNPRKRRNCSRSLSDAVLADVSIPLGVIIVAGAVCSCMTYLYGGHSGTAEEEWLAGCLVAVGVLVLQAGKHVLQDCCRWRTPLSLVHWLGISSALYAWVLFPGAALSSLEAAATASTMQVILQSLTTWLSFSHLSALVPASSLILNTLTIVVELQRIVDRWLAPHIGLRGALGAAYFVYQAWSHPALGLKIRAAAGEQLPGYNDRERVSDDVYRQAVEDLTQALRLQRDRAISDSDVAKRAVEALGAVAAAEADGFRKLQLLTMALQTQLALHAAAGTGAVNHVAALNSKLDRE